MKEKNAKKAEEKRSWESRIKRMKIPEDGICCPWCKGKNLETKVPWQCCLPTIEVCTDCGAEIVIEDDEILYFAKENEKDTD